MDVAVTAQRSFITARYGEIIVGQRFMCAPHLAAQWSDAGMVSIDTESYDTKVIDQAPSKPRRKKKQSDQR